MLSSNYDWLALPDKLIGLILRSKEVLTPQFFKASELIWEAMGTICIYLFIGIVLFIGASIALKNDSIHAIFATVFLCGIILTVHAINIRIFRVIDKFVIGNSLYVTDFILTDATAVFLITTLAFIPILIFGNTSIPTSVMTYLGATGLLVAAYFISYFLNPSILNIEQSSTAPIGENGLTYIAVFSGIGIARLLRLAYGIVLLNAFLMILHGSIEVIVLSGISIDSAVDDLKRFSAARIDLLGAGFFMTLLCVFIPLPSLLYTATTHVIIDALTGLVRQKQAPSNLSSLTATVVPESRATSNADQYNSLDASSDA